MSPNETIEQPVASGASSRARLLSIIGGIYIAPVALLYVGVIPFQWRFAVLIAMTLAIVFLAARNHTAAGLGLELRRLSGVVAWTVIPSMLLLGILYASGLTHRLPMNQRLPFFLFFAFISAPAQEFIYRSFLCTQLAAVRMPVIAIAIVSGILYGGMHIIYRDYTTVALTFLVGALWALIFVRTRNFYTVALSHAALGSVAILLGVV